ncbi:hypothetical protein BST61_g3274 [Cercospora zeina]
MFVDDRPLSVFPPTQGWNLYQPVPKKPPIDSPSSSLSHTEPKTSAPPLLSKSSSSPSLQSTEKNIPPFQTFLLRTPPLERNHDKPLPTPPVQPPTSESSSDRRRSSSVYSRTPSQWAPESVASWQTDDLQEDVRVPERPIAYSSSVPDLNMVADALGVPNALLEPRAFAPLLTSPTVSTIMSDTSPFASRPATTLLPHLEAAISPAHSINTIPLVEARESIHSPGAQRLLPEELLAQTMSNTKSTLHSRTTSADFFGVRALSSPIEDPMSTTLVDGQGRTRSITTPPAISSQQPEFSFPAPQRQLPAVNAFHVGSGPARDMAPPATTVSNDPAALPRHEGEKENETQPGSKKLSLDLSKYNIPASPETFVNDAYRFELGDEPKTAAEEYHTLLAQEDKQPHFDTTGYDSDDSIRRHMKMIPQPLFYGKNRVQKSTSQRKSSSASRYSSSQNSVASSGRGSNSFDLRLSTSTAGSRHARGSSGFGEIPISPPPQQSRPVKNESPI